MRDEHEPGAGFMLAVAFVLVVVTFGFSWCVAGCTVAAKRNGNHYLAVIGGKVTQADTGEGYAVTSDQERSLRETIAGVVSYATIQTIEAISKLNISEGEKTTRLGLTEGTKQDAIAADLAEQETIKETIIKTQ